MSSRLCTCPYKLTDKVPKVLASLSASQRSMPVGKRAHLVMCLLHVMTHYVASMLYSHQGMRWASMAVSHL